ncbi:DUF397 domain-containing protein [Streptomyces sp. NPDC059352]|uniref:DUF397 domain-containing protein n=1 Tax=Streptomyces sp. NPDC059352 TaxID=3346810 RepID=UPI00368682F6
MWRREGRVTGSGTRTLRQRTGSRSGRDDCVEVATCPSAIHVRDSKSPAGPRLALAPAAWTEFLTQLG